MIAIGNSEISAAYVGNKEVLKVYCGNSVVYEKLLYDAEVEYIQSDEYACIDLGVQGDNTNLSYELLDYPLEFGEYAYIFGNFIVADDNSTRIMTPSNASHVINCNYNSKGGSSNVTLVQAALYTNTRYRHHLSYDKLFYNNKSATIKHVVGNDNNTNVALFNARVRTDPQSFSKIRVYWMRIWDGNTLLKDFIPVSINGKGALFDRVSGVVHPNLGGNDIIVGASLPTSYDSEVEYLQSDGSAYIDTEVNGDNDNLEFHIEYSYSTHVNYAGIIGNYIDEDTNVWRVITSNSSSKIILTCNSKASGSMTVDSTFNSKETLVLNKNKIVINGTETTVSGLTSGIVNNSPIALFNRSVVNPVFGRNIGLKIYKFQIYNNGILIKDFIPVRVGTVGYMFDKIESRFYRNRGYGDFTLGSDVNN